MKPSHVTEVCTKVRNIPKKIGVFLLFFCALKTRLVFCAHFERGKFMILLPLFNAYS